MATKTKNPPHYDPRAAQFGGEVAATCIPQIRPVIDALPPEDIYAFWSGLMIGFAAFARATLPPGQDIAVLEAVMKCAKKNQTPPKRKLN